MTDAVDKIIKGEDPITLVAGIDPSPDIQIGALAGWCVVLGQLVAAHERQLQIARVERDATLEKLDKVRDALTAMKARYEEAS